MKKIFSVHRFYQFFLNKKKMEQRALHSYNTYLQSVYKHLGSENTLTSTLNTFCKKIFGKKYKGTFPSDKIPTLDYRHPYCIINVDKHTEKGSHWLALAFRKGHIYVYDSFGRSVKRLIGNNWKKNMISTDPDAEQLSQQDDCGQRCIAWLMVFNQLGPSFAVLV